MITIDNDNEMFLLTSTLLTCVAGMVNVMSACSLVFHVGERWHEKACSACIRYLMMMMDQSGCHCSWLAGIDFRWLSQRGR